MRMASLVELDKLPCGQNFRGTNELHAGHAPGYPATRQVIRREPQF
jgi:hypothetical protein